MKSTFGAVTLAASLYAFTGFCLAAETTKEEIPGPQVSLRSIWEPPARAGGGAEKIGLQRYAAHADYVLKLGELPVDAGVSEKYSRLSGTGTSGLPKELSLLEFPVETTVPLFTLKNMYVRGSVTPSFAAGALRSARRDLYVAYEALLIYRVSDDLAFGAGAGFNQGFSGGISPLAGFILKSGRFTVEATDEPAVFYQLSREVKVFAESGGFLGTEEYRVRTAQGGDDVLTFRQWYAGAGIARKAGPGYLSLRAGRLFLRRFRTHEAPLEIKLRNGLYIALGLDLEY